MTSLERHDGGQARRMEAPPGIAGLTQISGRKAVGWEERCEMDVRYDLAEKSPEFGEELARHHTGGQLSVAPEHVDDAVLAKMKKPGVETYERFADMVACASEKTGGEQATGP